MLVLRQVSLRNLCRRFWPLVLTALIACGSSDGDGDEMGDDDAAEEPPPETPDLVTRHDSEPAGANCASGGTAVHAGLDRDGDGRLDDDEVEWTEYLCDEPLAQLLREEALSPTAECPEGGTAIHVGFDDDRDGVLDDDEIDHTTLLCDESQLWDGDVVEADWGDPIRLAAIHRARVVTGDVIVPVDGDVELAVLQVVGGHLAIHGGVTDLALPSLRTVGGRMDIDAPNLGALSLPSLEQVGADFFVTNTGVDEGGIEAPRLTAIGGRLMLWQNSRGAISMPSLSGVGGALELRGALTSLELDAVRTVGGDLVLYDRNLERLHLPALESLVGTIDLFSNALVSILLPALEEMGGDLNFPGYNAQDRLTLLSIPRLREIQGSVLLWGLPALESVDAGSLQIVEGGIEIRSAPALTSLGMGSLDRVGNGFVDSFELRDTGLEVLELPRLRLASHQITIGPNPALRAVRLPVLELAGSLYVHDTEMLNELTAPTLRFVESLFLAENPQLTSLDLGSLARPGQVLLVSVPIPDLSGLRGVVSVDGTLALVDLDEVQDLRGLETLYSAGTMNIRDNQALRSFEGAERLTQLAGSLHIIANPSLESIAGLADVAHIGETVQIDDNGALADLGLTGLLSVGGFLGIRNNGSLTTLGDLAALTSVGDYPEIHGNALVPPEEIEALLARLGF